MLWFVGFSLLALGIAIGVMRWSAARKGTTSSATNVAVAPVAATPVSTNAVGFGQLVGSWVRPDGGYVLEVRRASPEGRLELAYLNPSPIHVHRAEWTSEADGIHVLVELRDVNYPGATYRLRYVPGEDRLRGEYFQPALQQTFEVEFRRLPGGLNSVTQ